MNLDPNEIRALAYLAARRRPKGAGQWDEPGICENVAKVAHLDAGEVILATIRAAMNPHAKSPGVIPVLTGEHWRERSPVTTAPRNPPSRERCTICGHAETHAIHADDHAFEHDPRKPADATERVDQLRTALRGTPQ